MIFFPPSSSQGCQEVQTFNLMRLHNLKTLIVARSKHFQEKHFPYLPASLYTLDLSAVVITDLAQLPPHIQHLILCPAPSAHFVYPPFQYVPPRLDILEIDSNKHCIQSSSLHACRVKMWIHAPQESSPKGVDLSLFSIEKIVLKTHASFLFLPKSIQSVHLNHSFCSIRPSTSSCYLPELRLTVTKYASRWELSDFVSKLEEKL